MDVYMYCASLYCEDCGEKIKASLAGTDKEPKATCRRSLCGWKGSTKGLAKNSAGWFLCPECDAKGFGSYAFAVAIDETTFDSEDYPKGPYPDGGGEADSLQFCDDCGTFLENGLTSSGCDSVAADMLDAISHENRFPLRKEKDENSLKYRRAAMDTLRDSGIDWADIIRERLGIAS